MNNSKGFTLVELAIVLVIIGVILGGVIKGTELVKSAKYKRLYRDYQGVMTAYMTYFEKTGKIPGYDNTTSKIVDEDFWKALRTENAYPGDGTDGTNPKHVMGGNITAVTNAMATAAGHQYACFDGLTSDVIKSVDTLFDDGHGDSGDILASTDSATAGVDAFTSTDTMCIVLE